MKMVASLLGQGNFWPLKKNRTRSFSKQLAWWITPGKCIAVKSSCIWYTNVFLGRWNSFANIITHEYLRTIFGAQQESDFLFNPLAKHPSPVYGNEVSIEFNIIYRWHSAIGQQDEDWLTAVMSVLGGALTHQKGQQHTAMSTPPKREKDDHSAAGTDQSFFDSLIEPFNEHFSKATKEELEKGLPLAGAHRDIKTGLFGDADLVKILKRGYSQVASEVG